MLKNRFITLVFLPTITVFVIVFWIRGIMLLDPDFGWHLRMVELILQNGISKTDPFSYTMPSYPFVDHEWLTNVVMSKIYGWSGDGGVGTFGSCGPMDSGGSETSNYHLAVVGSLVETTGEKGLGQVAVWANLHG